LNAGYLGSTHTFFGAAASYATMATLSQSYDRRYGVGTFGAAIPTSSLALTRKPIGANSDVTLLSLFRPPTGVIEKYCGNLGQNSGANSFGVTVGDGASAVIRGRMYLSGTRTFGGGTIVTDTQTPISTVVRQKYNVEQALFVNGVKDPTTSAFTGGSFSQTHVGVTGSGANFSLFLLATWERALSDTEIWELSQDPYQIFYRPNRRIWVDVPSAGGDVTVAITGQSVATAQGSETGNNSIAASGQSIALSQGTETANNSVVVTGLSIATGLGIETASTSLALSGLSIATAQNTVTASVGGDVTVAASGQAIATAHGALALTVNKAATGQSIATAQGTVTANAGGDVTVAASGQSIVTAQATMLPASSKAVSGQSIATAQGSNVASIGAAVDGLSLSGALGAVTTLQSLALSSHLIGIAQGSLTPSTGGNVTVAASGVVITTAQGNLSTSTPVTLQYPLAGLVQSYPLAGLIQY
jgi:hypothetical protein